MWDRLKGIAARITVPDSAPYADPRMALAIAAKVAVEVGLEPLALESADVAQALADARRQDGVIARPIRYRLAKPKGKGISPVVFLEVSGEQVVAEFHGDGKAEEIARCLEDPSALRTALLDESLGFDRPMVERLVRHLQRELKQSSNLAVTAGYPVRIALFGSGRPSGTSQCARFSIEVSADRMHSKILADGAVNKVVHPEAILNKLKTMGIVGVDFGAIEAAAREISQGKSVNAVVAQGSPPEPPRGPFLARPTISSSKGTAVDGCAQPWEIAAVVAYREPGAIGSDVLGNELAIPSPARDSLVAGEGVIRTGGKFFAKVAGWVKIEGDSVKILPVSTFEGSVTAMTGRVHADESLVINGGVEAQAEVSAAQNIEINQSFSGAYLRCKANLVIKEGVSGGPNSLLRVGGSARVKFLQSGRLRCRGDVIIESNMTGGVIEAGGNVTVLDPQGGIFGGTIIAGGSISAPNIGRPIGQSPVVWFGSDVRATMRRQILLARKRRLEAVLAEVMRRGAGTATTGTERSAVAEVRAKNQKAKVQLERILTAIEQRMGALKTTSLPGAAMSVAGALSAGVKVGSGDFQLTVRDDALAVKASRGSSSIIFTALNPPVSKDAN